MFSRGLEGSVAERERLAREEALEQNLLIRNNRILLPSASEANSIVAAQVVHFAWPENLAATVMAVRANGSGPNIDVMRNVLYGRELEVAELDANIDDAEAAEQIVAQSRLGYGVIAVGAVADPNGGSFVSSLVDEILLRSELAGGHCSQSHEPSRATSRGLCPSTGSRGGQPLLTSGP